jgi:hypothetical protein
MGLRFFRRVKILPGVTLNFSKSGVSTSLGPRGAKVTLGTKGQRATVGIPGTGLSYTAHSKNKLPLIVKIIIFTVILVFLAVVFLGAVA